MTTEIIDKSLTRKLSGRARLLLEALLREAHQIHQISERPRGTLVLNDVLTAVSAAGCRRARRADCGRRSMRGWAHSSPATAPW